MSASQITPSAIRQWAKAQLPGTSLPDDEELSAISAGPAAQSLWQFLVTRVRSEENAQRARAALSLIQGDIGIMEDETEDELAELDAEIAAVQEEIRHLHAEGDMGESDGMFGTGDGGLGVEEMKKAFRDVVDDVEEEGEGKVEKALGALEEVRGEDDVEDVEMVRMRSRRELEKVLGECWALIASIQDEQVEVISSELEPLQARLKAVCTTMSVDHVSDVLCDVIEKRRIELRRASLSGMETCEMAADSEKARRDLAEDMQLRAFAEYERTMREYRKAKAQLDAEMERLGSEGEARGLAAELEGERAFLAFVRKEVEEEAGGRDEVRRMKMEVRRKNERIERMDRAGRAVVEGNRKLMQEIGEGGEREKIERDLERVGEEGIKVLQDLMRGIEQVRGWIDKGNIRGLERQANDGQGSDDDLIHRMEEWREALKISKRKEKANTNTEKNEHVLATLRLRASVATEAREQALQDVEEAIFPRIASAIAQAQRCRDGEARQVQHELDNVETPPGRAIALRLGMMQQRR